MYPADWPKCLFCELPALDGHFTCGRITCPEDEARLMVRAASLEPDDTKRAAVLRRLRAIVERKRDARDGGGS